jgi:N-acetylneuraminate synthase
MTEPRDIDLRGRRIGPGHPPFVIAEMSGNHNGSLERALAIVDAAAEAGADAVKIQTYTADTMTLDIADGDFRIDDPESPWFGRTLYDLYDEAHTPWDWHEPIFDRCAEHGIVGFGTPFDATAVDFLESLDNPIYKVASFENTDLPLLRRVAATGKPLLVSTGMATEAEIEECVRTVRGSGGADLVLLKCTSAYPAPAAEANLRTLARLRDLFDVQVGLSDHTPATAVSVAAVALGAIVVEKHLTLLRADRGVDAAFSLEPDELKALCAAVRTAWEALGEARFGATGGEEKSRRFRRSLYVTANLRAGEPLTRENVRAIRPGFGLPPKFLDEVLGKPVVRDVARGTPLTRDLVGE